MRVLLLQVAVLKHEWAFVIEKVGGIVAQTLKYKEHYAAVEGQLQCVLERLREPSLDALPRWR